MITGSDWKRLTPSARVEHRVDDLEGAILLRGPNPDAPPFTTATVRDGDGGFTKRTLDELHFEWKPAAGGGWKLRTTGAAATMFAIESRWSKLVEAACAPLKLDPRVVLTTIACEVGDLEPDAKGFVKAPRTENGYPRRMGERDAGDGARDAEDWANYLAKRAAGKGAIAHSSHGLMQTLISTAVLVRPDLFKDVDPSRYREVLWKPENSIACGVAYMASFPDAVKTDPLALRFHYGRGRVAEVAGSVWGADAYDDIVPLAYIAFWNDDAALLHGETIDVVETPPEPEKNHLGWLLFAALSGVACIAAGHQAAVLQKQVAAHKGEAGGPEVAA